MILQVAGINFSYNHHPILEGITFQLQRGQILGVMGVNGAGKSTLLKCLNRILAPRAGVVMLDGRDMKLMNRNHIATRMGYVPQHYSNESLTVFDAVLLGRKPYITWSPSRRDLSVVEKVLRRLNIDHLALRPTSQLSGGEIQKVVIARALAQEPDILLLDEPTSNLDLKNQLQVIKIITDAVRETRMSAVVALHDINLALRFVDQFLMLKEGMVHTLAPRDAITPVDIEEVYGLKVLLTCVGDYRVVIPIDHDKERVRG
jgi:iron complex transport system ATP-binding protein